MEIQMLMSTINKKNIEDLQLNEKNIKGSCIIVNQAPFDNGIIKKNDFIMYTYKEKGVSISRNLLLEYSNKDIGIITDDDVTFVKEYEKIIKDTYKKYPDADLITFNIKIGDEIKGWSKEFKHNFISIMSVISIQITFRIDKIKQKNIKFDTNFGINSNFNSGEENIFLNECLKNKLKIIHIPVLINSHPPIKTTGEVWSYDTIKTKGALSYKLLGKKKWLFLLYYLIFKNKYYKKNYKVKDVIKIFYSGVKDYKKIKGK